MNILYVSHKNINPILWNSCAAHAPVPYFLYEYLNPICNYAFDALILNNYEAVMPLPYKKIGNIKWFYQPFFCQQLGICISNEIASQSSNITGLFLNYLYSLFQKKRLTPYYYHQQWHDKSIIPTNDTFGGIKISKKDNYMLFLNKNYEQLQHFFSKNTTRNLAKTNKNALKFCINAIPISQVVQQYAAHTAPNISSQKKIPFYTFYNLQQACQALFLAQKAFVASVHTPTGECCASGIFLIHNQRIINILPTSTPLGKQYNAMFFLINELICQFANTPYMLDFEGSMVASVARFYAGFGAVNVPYFEVQKNSFLRKMQKKLFL